MRVEVRRTCSKRRCARPILPVFQSAVGQQSGGALEVVAGVGGDHALQIGEGGGVVAQFVLGEASAVEGIERIGALGQGAVKAGAGTGPVALVQAQQAKFLVVSRRWILPDGGFHLAHAAAALHKAECAGIEEFGEPLDGEIDERAQRPEEKDEIEPIETGLAAEEMNQRHRHQHKACIPQEKKWEIIRRILASRVPG